MVVCTLLSFDNGASVTETLNGQCDRCFGKEDL
jgi:hypothetical protein